MSDALIPYEEYHRRSMEIGDVDPSYAMLRYICNRFELNVEQRYWLAFLYATCYCGPTVFYIYNEFPDFENVNIGRLQRWWDKNKKRLVFQTDRRWIKNNDQFVEMFQSYSQMLCGLSQRRFYDQLIPGLLDERKRLNAAYESAYLSATSIKHMGRFSLFLYLEAVHVVTGFEMEPATMNILEAEACREGLARAHEMRYQAPLSRSRSQKEFDRLVASMCAVDLRNNVWNIETTLCAYGKYHKGKRYIGYYLDRQAEEIRKMESLVPEGVDWRVLWQYREEYYGPERTRDERLGTCGGSAELRSLRPTAP